MCFSSYEDIDVFFLTCLMNSVNPKSFFLNGNHMSAQNYVIIMLGFLALPGKGALSNQLKFIYLHTISGSECSFFYADAEKIYISSSCCNCFFGQIYVSYQLYSRFSVPLHVTKNFFKTTSGNSIMRSSVNKTLHISHQNYCACLFCC